MQTKKKGVIPDYEDDIFISYTHIDNDKLAKDHKGWVDYMHERLERRLHQLLGEEPAIWRDPKLNGNDIFANTLILKLQKIAILVAVLSPRYVNSEWCLKELREFCRNAKETGGIQVDNKSPIFKVVKTPIDESKYPEELRNLLGYQFYEEDPANGQPREFSHEMIFEDSFRKFMDKVNDLAWDIKRFIESLQTTPSGRLIPLPGLTVYLAETAADVNEKRDSIKRELQDKRYRVLPDRDYPSDYEKLKEAIREDLRRSDLSIHLIGETHDDNYGDPAKRLGFSKVRLQHELAVERGSDPKFVQLIWMPKGLKARSDKQQKLIDDLRSDADTQPSIEVLRDIMEEFKTNLLNKLKFLERLLNPAPPPSIHVALDKGDDVLPHMEPEEPLLLYLICDSLDYEAAIPIQNFFVGQKIETILSLTEGDACEVLKSHKENLKNCDVAMIFVDQAGDGWMQQKFRELIKISSIGRNAELLGKGLYITGPMTKQRVNFVSPGVSVIKDKGVFPQEELNRFVEEVRARQRARHQKAKGAAR